MTIDAEGWSREARRSPSPNFDKRTNESTIRLVVVHAISLPPGEFGGAWVEDFFLNRLDANAHPYFSEIISLNVSAHFFIRRDGSLTQFVSCLDRAWHAGVSCWKGADRCNDYSIGVELEGSDDAAFEAAQYASLNRLLLALHATYPIEAVVGHSDIAPGRKTDPGPCFDWRSVDNVCSSA